MNRSQSLSGILLLWTCFTAWAQPVQGPQTRLTYEDRSGTTGHTLILEGKSYGPYKDIAAAVYSTSGTAAAFVVVKRNRLWILAQGKETGPLPAGFELDRLQIADDGKVWVLTATRASTLEDEPPETLLWVNGKSYGPYPELTTVEYAETGGAWLAAVRSAPEEAGVLISGKAAGPFYTVDHAWLLPDGKGWGYVVSDSDGKVSVVTSEKTWPDIVGGNFAALYPREPHWGYSLRIGDEEEWIFVDGQTYSGYLNFQGLLLTPSGGHWAFEAEKLSDAGDSAVVVVDGREYPGENLVWSRLGTHESYTWTVREGGKISVQTLKLP